VLQKCFGDLVVTANEIGKIIEIKAELKNTHGNLFIETWSNRSSFTPGWLLKCQADWIWYYFVEDKQLYHIAMNELRTWSNTGAIFNYPERCQKKYEQLNDTWGRCVPIEVLRRELASFRGPVNPLELAESNSYGDFEDHFFD